MARVVNSCKYYAFEAFQSRDIFFLFQRGNKGLDNCQDALVACIVKLPAEENGRSKHQFSSISRAIYLRRTDSYCQFELTVIYKGKRSIYCFFILLSFCCLASGRISAQPYPALHSSCSSIRNFSNNTNRVSHLGQKGEAGSSCEVFIEFCNLIFL